MRCAAGSTRVGYAESSARPLRRRPARIARPARVRIRRRKPWVFARRRLFGWNVRLVTSLSNYFGEAHRPGTSGAGLLLRLTTRCAHRAPARRAGTTQEPSTTAAPRYAGHRGSVKRVPRSNLDTSEYPTDPTGDTPNLTGASRRLHLGFTATPSRLRRTAAPRLPGVVPTSGNLWKSMWTSTGRGRLPAHKP